MNWTKARFKGKTVWAAVDAGGELISESGRTPIRYSPKEGATIYRAGTGRLEPQGGATKELPEGTSADDRPKGSGRKSKGSGFGSAGRRTQAQAAAAAVDARQRIAALPEGTHLAFTDGACKGNPGPAGAGAVVKLADGRVLEAGRGLGIATNNVGELTAIDMALDLLEEGGVAKDEPVAIFTDSKYVNGVLVLGWKAKANRELILGIRERLKDWSQLEIDWVAGHVGIPENERADRLATGACG